jgi:NADPH:quinone reductase-like Zn-dependent oxidoreductase
LQSQIDGAEDRLRDRAQEIDMNGRTEMMRVVVARRPGGPDVLEIEMRPRPLPAEGEILVRIEAAGVNRPDVLQRMGFYPVPPGASDALGLEAAGEVVARGVNATHYALGARVIALAAATPTIASLTNAARCRSRRV